MTLQLLSFLLYFQVESFLTSIDSTQQLPQIICTFSYTESRYKQDNVMQISPILFEYKSRKYLWVRFLNMMFGYKSTNNKIISYIIGITHIKFMIQLYNGNMRRVIKGWSKGMYSKVENEDYKQKFEFFYKNVCKNNSESLKILSAHLMRNETPKYEY